MYPRKFSRSFLVAFLMGLMVATPSLAGPTLASGGPVDSTSPNASAQQSERVDVTFSFLMCPDGYDPTSQDDPAGTCVTPAPMSADATLGAAPDYVVSLDDFTEVETGVYTLSMSVGWSLHFGDFFPEGANASMIVGDGVMGGLITPQADGGSVTVYGYNQTEGTGTVAFTFLACPEGFNPSESPSIEPFVPCDQPIDAPEGANVGDAIANYDLDVALRGVDGTYFVRDIQQPVSLTIRDFEAQGTDIQISYPAEPWVRGMWSLDTTEPVTYLNVYVWDDTSNSTPEDPVGGGAIHLTLLSCPDGVDPTAPEADPGAECTQAIQPTGDAALTWDGGQTRLDSVQPDQYGSFTISQLPLNTPIAFTDLEPSARGAWTAVGVDDWNENGEPYVTLTGTETVNIALYYYDEESGSTPDEPVDGGTVYLSLRGCPEGIDPTGVATGTQGTEYCDNVIQATGDAALVWDGGEVRLDSLTPDENGNYTITGLPLNQTITFVDLQPSASDSWMAVGTADWTTDGNPFMAITSTETVYVSFYYYNEI